MKLRTETVLDPNVLTVADLVRAAAVRAKRKATDAPA